MGCGCGKSFRRHSAPVGKQQQRPSTMATPQRMPTQHQPTQAPQHIVQSASLSSRRAAARRQV
ncbi:hypothetical protein ACVJGD_001876 [Bradyrhizobium sp. USDA 10063]